MPLFLIGIILAATPLMYAGIIFYALAVVFQLITLPVEFNASRRAIEAIEGAGILGSDEIQGSKKVLKAAAMTYVAALAVSLAQLLRLLILVGGGRRRD
jgi:Zn-dependent membrane protease YugP